MYSYKHYIPILRWKKAEQDALGLVDNEKKENITPLIELVPLSPRKKDKVIVKSKEDVLKETIASLPNKITDIWGHNRIYLDLFNVALFFQHLAATTVFTIINNESSNIIPVFRLNTDSSLIKEIVPYLRQHCNRFCLRLIREDINGDLKLRITKFLEQYDVTPNNVDLLFDMKLVHCDESTLLENFISSIPYLGEWKNFIVAGGSFPPDMSNFDVNTGSKHLWPRSDWITWVTITTKANQSIRKPSYSDYTIQHPIFLDTSTFFPSANIRYASNKSWIVMRGRKLIDHGFLQYLGLANLLLQEKEYLGDKFSKGDEYIAEKGSNMSATKPGTPTTWLRAGINHHISLVVDQIIKLDD